MLAQNAHIGGIGVNRTAIMREIPHFGLFPACIPAFLPEHPAFLHGFISKLQKSLKIAIIFTVGDIFFEKALPKRQ